MNPLWGNRDEKKIYSNLRELVMRKAIPDLKIEWMQDSEKRLVILQFIFGVGMQITKELHASSDALSKSVQKLFIKEFGMSEMQAEFEVFRLSEVDESSPASRIVSAGLTGMEMFMNKETFSPFDELTRILSNPSN